MNTPEYLTGLANPSIGRRQVDLTEAMLPTIRAHIQDNRDAIVSGCNNQPGEVVSYMFRIAIEKIADVNAGDQTRFHADFKLVWSKKDQQFDRVVFALPNAVDYLFVRLPDDIR